MLTNSPDPLFKSASSRQFEKNPTAVTEATLDAELVRRFRAGDEAPFAEIMTRYRNKIFNLTLGMLRDRADAEEITQDTFIRAHRGLANFRGDSSLATWLYRIAVNLARNRYWYYRRRHRQDSLSFDHALGTDSAATFSDLIASSEHDPAQQTVAGEFAALVDACLAQLDPMHREILVLRSVLGRPYEEIAATLGLNVGTVKSRLSRARENLRARLAAVCPEFAPEAAPSEWFLPARALYGRPAIACA